MIGNVGCEGFGEGLKTNSTLHFLCLTSLSLSESSCAFL